ncbi:MAG: MFS transporter [Verrucomicrobia subdivision 3 bacterium]|nr:MFS transporter [Limisphaerales bacterium]
MPNPTSPDAIHPPTATHFGRPSGARYWVVVFAITLAVIQYIDRICISKAEPFITKDLGLAKWQMGWVFSAFTLSYALFEIPCGYLGDRIGPRKVLMRIVIWWSLFTAATGWVWNWMSLVITRFLFGAGEAGCFPNLTKAFNRWLPLHERTRAQGIMWMSARWGGALTPLLVYWCLQYMHWRTSFLVFGMLGVVWAVIFFMWYRDDPRQHPAVNSAEAALLPTGQEHSDHLNVPWKKLYTSRTVWFLCAQYFAASYSWYFFITWFPKYLSEARGFKLTAESALLAGLPLFLGGFGSLTAGWISPYLSRWFGNVRTVRKGFGAVGFTAAAVLLIISTHLKNPYTAVIAIALVSFCNDLMMPGAWAACMDVGGKYVGTLSGTMNMMGNLGGFVSPIVIGYIIHLTNNWDLTFYVTAAIYVVGAACWLATDPVTPLEEQN